jgi:penicillin-binding protein 1C
MKIKGKLKVALLLIPLLFLSSLYLPFSHKKLSPFPVISLQILDHNGTILREVFSDKGGRCRWVELKEVSPYVWQAVIAAEDRYFFYHPGINLFSIIRAGIQNLRRRKIVSGASTITQQLVRNLNNHPRNIFSKLYETWSALRLEKNLSKEEILAQYLNRVCFGNMTYGIESASQLYFDKPCCDLSLAEGAFLAGLPRSPSRLNPYRAYNKAKKRQTAILKQMFQLKYIGHEKLKRAVCEPIRICSEEYKFRAPHFCEYLLTQLPPHIKYQKASIFTSLDYSIQKKVESLVKNHLDSLKTKNISNAAVIVMDNRDARILCMIGSKDFFDHSHNGQVNGSIALRQPGSTLKPFTYGLSLERGMTAADILEDREVQFLTSNGRYNPSNYDKKFHGPVRMRTALACSYNIPAVSLLQRLGPDLLYQKLKEAGFKSLKKSPGFYGIGLTLGNGEVSLLELVQAYSALARGGLFIKSKSFLHPIKKHNDIPIRIFSRQTAYILSHILSDNDARIPAFGYNSPLNLPFPCAAKTGTSKDFRDNWTIGFTTAHTVGVWVGNFDGKPMHNISGISGCGPLFRDIMLLLEKENQGRPFQEPDNLVRVKICPKSGKLASLSCPGEMEEIFIKGTEPHELCSHKIPLNAPLLPNNPEITISFPASGDIFKIDPILKIKYQTLNFKASVPEKIKPENLEWWLNGNIIYKLSSSSSLNWNLKPGSYTISITARWQDRKLKSRPVKFLVLQ